MLKTNSGERGSEERGLASAEAASPDRSPCNNPGETGWWLGPGGRSGNGVKWLGRLPICFSLGDSTVEVCAAEVGLIKG